MKLIVTEVDMNKKATGKPTPQASQYSLYHISFQIANFLKLRKFVFFRFLKFFKDPRTEAYGKTYTDWKANK